MVQKSNMQEVSLGFLDYFELWDGLLESFFGYSSRESRCKQQASNCGFDVVDTGVYLFTLSLSLLSFDNA